MTRGVCRPQGLAIADVRARLQLPAFVTAAHQVVTAAAEALPALRAVTRDSLQRQLAAVAARLQFVPRCTTCIQRRDGADLASGKAQQVGTVAGDVPRHDVSSHLSAAAPIDYPIALASPARKDPF